MSFGKKGTIERIAAAPPMMDRRDSREGSPKSGKLSEYVKSFIRRAHPSRSQPLVSRTKIYCPISIDKILDLEQLVPIIGTMTDDDLKIFLHLAGSGSLSASARSLRQPKSSVSRALARIEADAGAVLFERSTRHFRLTDAGVLLRPYAERVVNDLQEVRLQLEGFIGEARGLVRVNTTPSFAQGLIAPMLPSLIERHPQLRVELETDPRTVDMVQEGIDLVVRIGALADSSLIARKLPSIDLLMVASPVYLARRGMPAEPSDLVDHDLVTRDSNSRWTFHKEGVERVIEPRGKLIIADAAAQKVVVEGGAGIACLPSYSASASIEAGSLVRLIVDWQRPPIDIHAIYPTRQGLSAKVRVFVDALTEHLARGTDTA